MSTAEHTPSLASADLAPAHPSQGAGRTTGISETRTTAPSARKGHIGLIVVGSLATGLAAAVLLVLVVFPGAVEPVVTGSVMLASGLGWAMLAALSVWRTDQPQRWALVPAAYFAITGTALLLFSPGDGTLSLLGWAWPPLLLALVVWIVVRARWQLRSWARPLVLYPVLVVLAHRSRRTSGYSHMPGSGSPYQLQEDPMTSCTHQARAAATPAPRPGPRSQPGQQPVTSMPARLRGPRGPVIWGAVWVLSRPCHRSAFGGWSPGPSARSGYP